MVICSRAERTQGTFEPLAGRASCRERGQHGAVVGVGGLGCQRPDQVLTGDSAPVDGGAGHARLDGYSVQGDSGEAPLGDRGGGGVDQCLVDHSGWTLRHFSIIVDT